MPLNNHYNKRNLNFARKHRHQMTKAEACLWKFALSKKQMLGYKFRRQRPIANYIVDFVCLPLKLVIEVDGYSHQLAENDAKDQIRQKALEDLAFTVIRFKDEEILNQINSVRQDVERWINKLEGN